MPESLTKEAPDLQQVHQAVVYDTTTFEMACWDSLGMKTYKLYPRHMEAHPIGCEEYSWHNGREQLYLSGSFRLRGRSALRCLAALGL